MALESSLEDAGFQVAGPFASNREALAWLESHTPDVAIVDVLLRDGPCTPTVHALRQRKIPFVIYSGLKPRARPPELAAVPWLEKPAARKDLTTVLLDLTPKPFRAEQTYALQSA
jgi:DNA-binding response OmpR family regulator